MKWQLWRRRPTEANEHERAESIERRARRASAARLERRLREAAKRLSGPSWHLRQRAERRRVPWYVVLGAAGAGKTTLLTRSSLELTRLSLPNAAEPAEPAPLCEFWVCNRAVLLELSPALLAPEAASHEWRVFGAWLARERRSMPPQGALVVVNLSQLQRHTSTQAAQDADLLRSRLDDLRERCEAAIPADLLLTFADEIPGFGEYFGPADFDRMARPWSVAFELPASSRRAAELEAAFEEQLKQLETLACSGLPARVARLREPAAKALGLRFPERLAALRPELARLAAQFGASAEPGFASPLLGCHLCARGPGSGARRYFGEQALERHILRAAASVQRSPRHVRRQFRRQCLQLGAFVLGLLLVILPAAHSYVDNLALIEETCSAAAARGESTTGARAPFDLARSLEPALIDAQLSALQRVESAASEFHVRYWWGTYAAPLLLQPLTSLYRTELRKSVEGAVQEQLLASLRADLDVARRDTAAFEATYTDLRLYLMLTRPQRLDVAWAAPELSRVWQRVRQRGAYTGRGDLRVHADRFVQALALHPAWSWPEDAALVGRARGLLGAVTLLEVAYARLERAAAPAVGVRAAEIFTGGAARHVRTLDIARVPAAYTAQGWELIRPALAANASPDIDAWVLFEEPQPLSLSMERLRAMYFDRYGRAWLDFLVSLDIAQPSTLQDAIDQLHQLGQSEGPLVRLFRQLGSGARLEWPPDPARVALQVAQGKAPGEALAGARVVELEQRFRSLFSFGFGSSNGPQPAPDAPLQQYLEQLRGVELALRQLGLGELQLNAAFAARPAAALATVQGLLTQLPDGERLALERLLLGPLHNVRSLLGKRDSAQMTELWQNEIWPELEQLRVQYPFRRDARTQASLVRVSELLRPKQGALWRFYDAHLAMRVTEYDDRFENRSSSEPLAPALLGCLQAARQLGTALFGTGDKPAFTFAVKLPAAAPQSSLSFEVDGQTVGGEASAERWQTLTWPGAAGSAGAAIRLVAPPFSGELRREGDFGLMRLLQEGRLRPQAGSARVFEAEFRIDRAPAPIRLQVRPAAPEHPLLTEPFERLACPAWPLAGPVGGAG